jgi:hypothetical protein
MCTLWLSPKSASFQKLTDKEWEYRVMKKMESSPKQRLQHFLLSTSLKGETIDISYRDVCLHLYLTKKRRALQM